MIDKRIKRQAKIEAKRLVYRMYRQMNRRRKAESFVVAKRCALICQSAMMRIRRKTYYGVPGAWMIDYLVLKQLPEEINNVKEKL